MKVLGADEGRIRTSTHAWGTRVVLSAPQVRNALDPGAVSALLEVFARDEPGAVLLCADGPAFCSGGDLSVLAGAAAAGGLTGLLATQAAMFADLVEAVVSCPRPVVAAIDGPAVGGGVSLALACDLRLVTPRARLVLGWARWGLPPDGGAAALLTAAVGHLAARALLVEAAEIGAESLLAPVLFTRVLPPDRLDADAIATVSALAASPGAGTAKAAAAAPLLAALRAGREEELAALARAAADPSVVARLANLYKMEQ
jgi:2-(1,2-epoxy-1,2-dihydrophenyl)acetyl-CoA isomerase